MSQHPYRCIFWTIFVILSPIFCRAQTDTLQATAERGDGIYGLLRRYGLADNRCNIDQFCKLNGMEREDQLSVGKDYLLPVQVYTYNGESIRSTIDDNDWDQAVAIQTYNEAMLEAGRRATDFRDDRMLWVAHHLLHCREAAQNVATTPTTEIVESDRESSVLDREITPVGDQVTTSGNRVFDIFGPSHSRVPLLNRKLAGRIFYIVSGHGGPDPGSIGTRAGHRLCEDEYAYDVALRLCREIIMRGGVAYMVTRDENDGIRSEAYLDCDKDETYWGGISMSRSQRARLFQRSDIVNGLYRSNKQLGVSDQTLIAIHVDSRNSAKRIDAFFYYHRDDPTGLSLATNMKRVLNQQYKRYQPGREYSGTVSARDLHMLRETEVPGVYIELANIRNPVDQQRIVVERNRQLLAEWLLMGILE
ncbi:MAG: N-acetylmuramoyl-L-alanine amidase [Bacteroidota bacterium]